MVRDPTRRQGLSPWPGSLSRLEHALEVVRREDGDMPVGWLLLLLGVAKFQHIEEGVSARDLADKMSFPYPTVAEVVKKMSAPTTRFPTATGLLEQKVSRLDERRKDLLLSGKGRMLIERLAAILEAGPKA